MELFNIGNKVLCWWNGLLRYRIPIEVDAGEYVRFDIPAEIEINFSDILKTYGAADPFNENSIRLVEIDNNCLVLNKSVPFQFDRSPDYNPVSKATGCVVFIISGVTKPQYKRMFHLYFDTDPEIGPGLMQAQIKVANAFAHGADHWKITAANATYMFDIKGGALSELRDRDGEDWIQFDNSCPPVQYRGIPNIQTYLEERKDTGIFHPGFKTAESFIENEGPLKISILTSTYKLDSKWVCRWEIYPMFARCTVLQGGECGFGFLYEGVPGGNGFSSNDDFIVESDGEKTYFKPSNFKPLWTHNKSPKWVYFGDDKVYRVLYYAYKEEKSTWEKMYEVFDQLTVFGFGRESIPGINEYPAHFTLGFCESADFTYVEKYVNSAYRDLIVKSGTAECYML